MIVRPLTFLSALVLFCGATISVRLAAENPSSGFTTFDAPGAGTATGLGTFPRSINAAGAITGHYSDATNVIHGFLSSPAGNKLITFDAPGAHSAATFGTFPESINAAGAITGHYNDENNVNHGFLRSPAGDITTFDVPGASAAAGSGLGTYPESINAAGAIVGHYTDAHNVNHGFLRSPRGDIKTFDVPGADTTEDSGNGTIPDSINDAGAITGRFVTRNWRGIVNHGFLRSPAGDFTTFDAPGVSSHPGDGTFPRAINRDGTITGNYSLKHQEVNRGFLRSPAGTFTTFQAPGADTTKGSGNGTFPESINDAGAITGRFVGRSSQGIVYHGFLRSPAGEFATLDAPGSSSAQDDGTFPRSINASGAIVGKYSAAAREVNRGFIRTPTAIPSRPERDAD